MLGAGLVRFASLAPLTLSLSPWERGRLLNGYSGTPSPMGRGLG